MILGVQGSAHPLREYLTAGVPAVLASDDEGVSRIDLSTEYLRAAREQGLGYRQLKQLSRNALEYSFLPGTSLWHDAAAAHPAPACRRDTLGTAAPSAGCAALLAASPRAQRQWALEAALGRLRAACPTGAAPAAETARRPSGPGFVQRRQLGGAQPRVGQRAGRFQDRVGNRAGCAS